MKNKRSGGSKYLTRTGCWVINLFLLLFIATVWIGPDISSQRYHRGTIQTEGAKVISAIEDYSRDHGALPTRLIDLVPEYLPKLGKVTYTSKKSYNWPYKYFKGERKSAWAYKTSPDGKRYVLAVEAFTRFYYDSETGDWDTSDPIHITTYDKPATAD